MKKALRWLFAVMAIWTLAACDDGDGSAVNEDTLGDQGEQDVAEDQADDNQGALDVESEVEEGLLSPVILEFKTDSSVIYYGELLVFSAVVTDPQGAEDILSVSLADDTGVSLGAMLLTEGGRYELELGWSELMGDHALTEVEGVEGVAKNYLVTAYDNTGHSVTETLSLTFDCKYGRLLCGGYCEDTQISEYHCGGCGIECGPAETCSDYRCQ